jgi:hypothetical protein
MFGIGRKKYRNKEFEYYIDEETGRSFNEWSYQRFCGFYDKKILPDELFYKKIEKIIYCVRNKNMESIQEIAKNSNCSFEECILKLNYLKNKQILNDLYIDRINQVIKKCSEEDIKILEKYYNMLYVDHFQLIEMAIRMPNLYNRPLEEISDEIFNDLKYLYDKCIINGIKLDEEHKKIIYYTVEKHTKANVYISVNCNKCGALVDIPFGGHARCSYCNSMNEDTDVIQ